MSAAPDTADAVTVAVESASAKDAVVVIAPAAGASAVA